MSNILEAVSCLCCFCSSSSATWELAVFITRLLVVPGVVQGPRLHELGTDIKERILVVVRVDLFGWVCEQEVHRRVVSETCHVSDDSPRKKVVGEKEFLGVNERNTVVVDEETNRC